MQAIWRRRARVPVVEPSSAASSWADGKRSFVLEDTEKWFADDLRSLLSTSHLHSNVSWFDVDL
jgi:hypothetical protein